MRLTQAGVHARGPSGLRGFGTNSAPATQENVVACPRTRPDYPRNHRPLPKKSGQLPKNLPPTTQEIAQTPTTARPRCSRTATAGGLQEREGAERWHLSERYGLTDAGTAKVPHRLPACYHLSDPAYRMSDPFATLYGTPTGRRPSAFAVPFRATLQADEE